MAEIEKNDFNLYIFRYVSTAKPEVQIDLNAVNTKLLEGLQAHNVYLKALGLSTI